jgi:hypothetical protein
MKNSLSFVSTVRPCNLAEGEAKLEKKTTIEGCTIVNL